MTAFIQMASLVLFGLLLIAFGFYFMLRANKRNEAIEASQTWPIVTGTATQTGVEKYWDGENAVWLFYPKVTVRYSVSGIEYIRWPAIQAESSLNLAENVINRVSKEGIIFHYNPQKPGESITNYDRKEGSAPYLGGAFLILFGTVFIIFISTIDFG